jgi:hypothetical protein
MDFCNGVGLQCHRLANLYDYPASEATIGVPSFLAIDMGLTDNGSTWGLANCLGKLQAPASQF